MAKAIWALSGLLATSSVAGSAQPTELQNVERADAGETLIMGAIRYRKNRIETACGEMLESCHIVLAPPLGGKALTFAFRNGGPFAWTLPPGDYVIAGLDRGRNRKSIQSVLHVPADAGAVYFGELVFDISDEGMRFWIDDDFGGASRRFDQRFPEKAGMLTQRLVGDYGNPGTFDNVVPICARNWGMTCTLARQGLKPTLPTRSRGPNFTVRESQPTLAWEPIELSGVTYDLALFDAVSFRGIPYQGHVLAYRQGLERASWRPEQILEPDRTYFWSVRLRRDNTVSTWSSQTASYAAGFLGMNMAVAYGEWFRFDTPKENIKP